MNPYAEVRGNIRQSVSCPPDLLERLLTLRIPFALDVHREGGALIMLISYFTLFAHPNFRDARKFSAIHEETNLASSCSLKFEEFPAANRRSAF